MVGWGLQARGGKKAWKLLLPPGWNPAPPGLGKPRQSGAEAPWEEVDGPAKLGM